jgi:Zn-dependent M28 family amino/carboxypeptidase
VRWKAIAARNGGAKALIIIAKGETFKEDPLARLRYDNSAGDSGLPVAAVSRQAARKLLNLSEPGGVAELEKTMTSANRASSSQPDPVTVSLSIDLLRQDVTAFNIVGILDGSDPVLRKEAIVIGAHYDHLGRGGEGSLAPKEGEIHHGADDNASGVAGILELARSFAFSRPKPRRTIIFIAFSGEEEGLLGSSYYVNNPVVPLASTVAMINLDMIGRSRDKKLVIGGIGTAKEWREWVEAANLSVTSNSASAHSAPAQFASNGNSITTSESSKYFQLTLNEDGFGPSDHSSFYAKQVPVLFFWTGTHSDYHKPSDTAEKINYDDEANLLDMVSKIVRRLDANDLRPTYTVAKAPAQGRSTGFRVYLGTIPNYADGNDGLLLDGVRDDSPAAKAGLKAGDKIVKLAGRDIRNVYDYTYALGEMKAGQEYEIEIVRGAERLRLKLIPEAKK